MSSITDPQDQNPSSERPQDSIRILFDGSSMENIRASQTCGGLKFGAWIPQGTLSEGHYYVIWCVAPDHRMLFDELIFEVEVAPIKYKMWAQLSIDELQSIRSTDTLGRLRLRLQQILYIRDAGDVFVRLSGRIHVNSVDTEATLPRVSHFQVHYMELTRLGVEVSDINHDYEVKAPGRLLQQIDVRMCAPMAKIIAVDVSSTGGYVAIFSADQYNAYVGIWDMDTTLHKTPTGATDNRECHSRPSLSSNPMASTTIPLQKGDLDVVRLVRVAISSDGLRAVLFQQSHHGGPASEKAISGSSLFSFRNLRIEEKYALAEDLQGTPTHLMRMVVDAIPLFMNQFVGYGKFMSRDAFRADSQVSGKVIDVSKGDYFVACTASRIAVYDVDNGFQPLYGISIGGLYSMKSRVNQLQMLHQSLQGPAFVWLEDLQNVSVWDIVSGTNLTYISIHNPHSQPQDEIEYITVSPGGKLMALAGKNWIKTYFMDSGLEISSKAIHEGDILSIEFLDHDKTLVVAIGKPSMEQISLIMDAMSLSSWNSSPRTFASSSYSIQHVFNPSGMTTWSQKIGGAMMGVNHSVLEVFAIPQPGVFISGGPLFGCEDHCAETGHQKLDRHTYQHPGSHLQYQLAVEFEERESGNRRHKVARVRVYSVKNPGQEQDVVTIVPEPWRMLNENEENAGINASFIGFWPQFIITTSVGFQVWDLPYISPDNRCEMALSWVKPCSDDTSINDEACSYAEKIFEIGVCEHGECIKASWLDIRTNCIKPEWIRIPKSNWISQTETLHCINGIPLLASCYTGSSTTAKEAIVRYIVRHINHDPPEGTIDDSVMTKIARSAKWECCAERPRTKGPANSIKLLVEDAKKIPQSLPMAEQMMDYCIRQAKSQCDVGFIVPVLLCLRKLTDHHPETAIDVTRRMAFIPVKNQDFLVNHSILARPVWRPIRDKIMRIGEVSRELTVDPMNKSFKGQVYVAPYLLLWHHTKDGEIVQSTMNASVQPNHVEMIATLIRTTLNPWGGRTVLANFSDLDYFDNPAVEALIQYKWDSVAWKTWTIRRLFQSAYYLLIVIVASLQIYPIMRIAYLQVFLYAIIAMSLFFLHLELKQFLAGSYVTSPYNLADVLVFVTPLAGSIQLLLNIAIYESTDALGNSRGLSYSIMLVFTHVLCELRVFKSICHATTLVLSISYEIISVVFVLMLCIMSFAGGMLHLLRARTHDCISMDDNGNMILGPWSCPTRDTDFPLDPFDAFMASFYMMSGQYDAVKKELQAGDPDIRFLGILYFTSTVVIAMNIVIAIANHAMVKATYYGPLSWLSNLLRAAVTAETLSVTAGEYREQVDLFPQCVYYAVLPSRMAEFKEKHQRLFDRDESPQLPVAERRLTDTGTSRPRVTALQQQNQREHDQSIEVIQSTGILRHVQRGQGKPIAVRGAKNPPGLQLPLEPRESCEAEQFSRSENLSIPRYQQEIRLVERRSLMDSFLSQDGSARQGLQQEHELHTQQRREESMDRRIQDDVYGQETTFAIGAPLSLNVQACSGFEDGPGPTGGTVQRSNDSIEGRGAGCHIADGNRNHGAPFQHQQLQEELRAVQETVKNLGQMTALFLQQQEQYQQRLELRLQQLQQQLTQQLLITRDA
ncbi:MAG: hypothetical protein J3Q66DRAFT_406331 [Benniella sp.]|nr:MAG: hypothetical protein J3Q66DRAFT_406331 [Benniella sp.]